MPNLSSVGCFEAELESLTPHDAGRMPGETKANPSTAQWSRRGGLAKNFFSSNMRFIYSIHP